MVEETAAWFDQIQVTNVVVPSARPGIAASIAAGTVQPGSCEGSGHRPHSARTRGSAP
jgi:hypothetical protein